MPRLRARRKPLAAAENKTGLRLGKSRHLPFVPPRKRKNETCPTEQPPAKTPLMYFGLIEGVMVLF